MAVKKKHAHKRSPTERQADLLWLEREYLRGTRNPERLASMLARERRYRIGEAQIRYDLAQLRGIWCEAIKSTYEEHVQSALAELAEQERELWAAWEKSKLDEKTETEKVKGVAFNAGGPGDGQPAPVQETERGKKRVGQCGDPSYMRLILDVQIRRCKLLGLDRPQRVEVDHSGAIATTVDVDSLELDLETRKKLLAAVRKSNGAGRV